MATSQFANNYITYSGADIRAIFNGRTMGNLQALSYSIHREKAAIYVMGHPDPLSFSRGKRAIGGALVFIQFDQDPIIDFASAAGMKFYQDTDAYKPHSVPNYAGLGTDTLAGGVDGAGNAATALGSNTQTNVTSSKTLQAAFYADQIPPFDVAITFNNEYGSSSKMAIYGIELMGEGGGFSVDDLVLEKQHSYVARAVEQLTRVRKPNPNGALYGGN